MTVKLVRLTDTLSTAPLVAGELFRRGHRWVRTGPLSAAMSNPLSGPAIDGWANCPIDLRPVDPARADDFYAGRYWFENLGRETGGESPFSVEPPSANWLHHLHGFRWLRHLAAADTELSRAHGAALLQDWIVLQGNQPGSAPWQAATLSDRLIAWAAHAPKLLVKSPEHHNKTVRRSIARQVRFLQNAMSTLPVNEIRLAAAIAVVHACVCMSKNDRALKQALRDLDREIERQILSDGGHISRNPVVLVHLLADLIPLRNVFDAMGVSFSQPSLQAIDRMSAALRFFQHSNGTLASFNGTGETPMDMLGTLLADSASQDGIANQVQQSAPSTGYERLAAQDTVVVMDTGKPGSHAASTNALAGALSFELSSGKNVFIMNCGKPENGFEDYLPFSRSTAAHSTAIVADTSSSRFAAESTVQSFLPSLLLNAPATFTSQRRDTAELLAVDASHDGYATQFGLVHRRVVQLSLDGKTLNGVDRFEPTGRSQTGPTGQPVALRFHLPPGISASLLSSGHSILIAAPDHDAWTFTCIDASISLEESIRFSGVGGPRKTEQIVVSGHTERNLEIRWTLTRRGKKSTSRPRKKASAVPDLLSTLSNT